MDDPRDDEIKALRGKIQELQNNIEYARTQANMQIDSLQKALNEANAKVERLEAEIISLSNTKDPAPRE